nr:PREDICTED: uncharacterized protein LOC109039402 [Bemisia tabaci]
MVSKHLKGHDTQQATVQSSGQRNRVNITLTGKEDLDRMEKQLRESAEYAEQVKMELLLLGGIDGRDLLIRILKKLLPPAVCNEMTLKGAMRKQVRKFKFMDSKIQTVIFGKCYLPIFTVGLNEFQMEE